MSVLIESPMDFAFPSTASSSSAAASISRPLLLLNSRKRKSPEAVAEDEYDFAYEPAPKKLLRKEVNVEDVKKLDVHGTFQIDSCLQSDVECSISDSCLLITTRRLDHRLERRCIPLPDHVDQNSLCLCYDSNKRLLIGFNYIPGFRVTPSFS